MASDDMKKMLILIESCSCESNKEDTDEVTEGDEVDEMFFFPDTRSREEKNRAANEPQDILGRRPKQAIAKYGKEYKAMKKGTSAQDAADRERYGLGGPKGPLPESFEAFVESMREMAGGQLDELSPDTYYSASKAREAQKIALAKKMGIGSFHMDDKDAPAALRALKVSQDRLRDAYSRRRGDIEDFDKQVAAVQGMSPATARKLGMTPTKKFTKADGKKVTDTRLDSPTAPAVKESEPTQEDAEFQSFMETLNYVMKK